MRQARYVTQAALAAAIAGSPASASNLDTVGSLYTAFGAGDVPAILSMLADDVAWDHGYEGTSIATLAPRTGPQEVGGFFESLAALEFRKFEILNMLEGGNQVAVVVDVELAGRDTGKTFDDVELHLWTFGEDGKVTAFRHFLDMEEYAALFAE